MVEIELTLIVLLDFYSTVWLENPGKFPKLKNQLTADRVRKHGEKASFHKDFIILIQQYVLFYYKQSVTNIFGKNAKRAIAKIIKGGTSILKVEDQRQDKDIDYSCNSCVEYRKRNEILVNDSKDHNYLKV